MALKMHGALSSAALGKRLGTTGEAARQQLLRLSEQGLVAAASEAKGVGRPQQLWRLTPASQTHFPDTHAGLTVQLLDIIRKKLGEAALDTIISVREKETRLAYEQELVGKLSLAAKVARLVELRVDEGYMAEWHRLPDGAIALVENHCPICAAATACAGFCRAELSVFRKALGPSVSITREEHMLDGGRRCTYVIRQSQESDRGARSGAKQKKKTTRSDHRRSDGSDS